jgi:hypothetical protein
VLFPTIEPLRLGDGSSGNFGLWVVSGVLGFFTLSAVIAAFRIFWLRG